MTNTEPTLETLDDNELNTLTGGNSVHYWYYGGGYLLTEYPDGTQSFDTIDSTCGADHIVW